MQTRWKPAGLRQHVQVLPSYACGLFLVLYLPHDSDHCVCHHHNHHHQAQLMLYAHLSL